MSWWREPILLTVAQQREPTSLLESLFNHSPLLAVAAVAECPTPPISMQSKAIEVCLEYIDSTDKAVGSATVTLMRKVKGDQEIFLLNELEKRLKANHEINSLVGLSLATAGTPKATELLAKHPELWDTCLKEVGYLSTSFENLLVEWVQNGSQEQSIRAIDMIVSRLSVDRMNQLIGILPTLKSKQAEYLSSLLLEKLSEENIRPIDSYRDSNLFEIISKCSPYISNTNLFNEKDEKNVNHHPLMDAHRMLIKKAIRIFQKKTIQDSSQLFSIICNANKWSEQRSQIIVFACACLSLIASLSQNYVALYFHYFLPAIMLIFLLAISFPFSRPPWMGNIYFIDSGFPKLIFNLIIFLLGIYTLYTMGYSKQEGTVENSSAFYLLSILMIVLGYIKDDRYYYFIERYSCSGGLNTFPLAGVIYALTVLVFFIIDHYFQNLQYTKLILLSISSFYFSCLMYFFIRLFIDWRILKNA